MKLNKELSELIGRCTITTYRNGINKSTYILSAVLNVEDDEIVNIQKKTERSRIVAINVENQQELDVIADMVGKSLYIEYVHYMYMLVHNGVPVAVIQKREDETWMNAEGTITADNPISVLLDTDEMKVISAVMELNGFNEWFRINAHHLKGVKC